MTHVVDDRYIECPICGLPARVMQEYHDPVHDLEMIVARCMVEDRGNYWISATKHYLGMPAADAVPYPTPLDGP